MSRSSFRMKLLRSNPLSRTHRLPACCQAVRDGRLSAETEPLKELTLGQTYPAKKWPRCSVIVELSANSKPEHPEYTVGVAPRPSAALEFFAPLFSDVPFKGMNELKERVAPDCKNRKTESSR
jgi:hypothetical protein